MISVSVRKKSVFGAMLLILACTLFAQVTAHAETNEISIQSVTLSSTEGNTEEINPATTDGQKINLDLKLYDPGDSVTYTVEIKNNTDRNFYIDDESVASIISAKKLQDKMETIGQVYKLSVDQYKKGVILNLLPKSTIENIISRL